MKKAQYNSRKQKLQNLSIKLYAYTSAKEKGGYIAAQ